MKSTLKRVILFLTIFFFIIQLPAQDDVKKIIFDDLLRLDKLYPGCLFQSEQRIMIVSDKDTIKINGTLEEIQENYKRIITIHELDSCFGFYHVKVSFSLIFMGDDFYYYKEDKFYDEIFSYTLYRSNLDAKYYKINGFLISEILDMHRQGISIEYIKEYGKIDIPRKIFKKYLNRDAYKIRDYLSVSILEKLNKSYSFIDYRPYVKNDICFLGSF